MSETLAGANGELTPSLGGTLELVSRAARDGAADASEAAAKTWDTVSRFTCRFVYTTCYTVSYGVVFPATLLARSIPKENAAVLGLIEGARAARLKVEEIRGPEPEAWAESGVGASETA